MKFEQKNVRFVRTNRGQIGIPAMWENEKKYPQMTKTTKLFDETGKSLDPIYISTRKNSNLVPITEGSLILKTFVEENGNKGITLLRILKVDAYSNEALSEVVLRKASDQPDIILNEDAEPVSDSCYKQIQKHF